MSDTKISDLIYQSKLPVHFYVLRWFLVFAFVFLIIIKVDTLILALLLLPIILFIGNDDNYVVEIYDEYFKIILPSFYGTKFKTEDCYFYKDVSNFTFERGKYNWLSAIIGEITKLIIPNVVMGFLFSYKKPVMRFKLNGEKDIEFILNDNNPSLLKSVDLLEEYLSPSINSNKKSYIKTNGKKRFNSNHSK